MELTPLSTVKQRLDSYPDTLRQGYLLLAVLREILYLFLALLRGNVSLEDVHKRLSSLQPECDASQDTSRSDSPVALIPTPMSEIQDTESTVILAEPERPQSIMNPVRTLCRTIVQGNVTVVSRMLKAAPRLVRKRHEGGWMPLHAAVLSGNVETVKLVLECPKVEVNVQYKANKYTDPTVRESELGTHLEDTNGATPLHYACLVGNVDIIRLLVNRGADYTAYDSKPREPIEYFDFERDLDAAALFHELYEQKKAREDFLKDYSEVNDLAELIRENKFELFERSIKKNPKVSKSLTEYDFSLLHLAVIRQRRQFVELLVSLDQSLVNKVDKRSVWSSQNSLNSFAPDHIPHRYVKDATPLHYACLMHDMEIARMLLEAGADWNIQDQRGRLAEELIYAMDATCEELKSTFAKLKAAEEERRKQREEKEGEEGEKRRKEEEKKKMDVDVEPEKEPEPSGGYESEGQGESHYEGSEYYESGGDDYYDEPDQPMTTHEQVNSKVTMEALLALEKTLEEKLVGQRGPIRSVANAIRLREGGWVDPDRPLTMLFLGSSGVGKTELAKQLALYIHGEDGLATDKGSSIAKLEKKRGFIRIDLSEYQEPHTVMNLIGAPKSYVGYGEGGALSRPLRKNPRAVVLLDEIEKAHPDVLTTFLQVFDDGRITDSKDGVISCKDAIFIMTSNIASDAIKEASPELRRLIRQTEEEARPEAYIHLIQDFTRSIRPQLRHHLRRDEFVGRINQIVVFLPLSQEEVEVAVERELAMWCKRAEEKHRISIAWTRDVVQKLALAYDVNYGVRSVANEVQRIALQLVADAQIRGFISHNWRAMLMTNEVGDVIMRSYSQDWTNSHLDDLDM